MRNNKKVEINIALLKEYMKQNNLSLYQFCKLCGISKNTYYSLKNGAKTRANTLIKIARATKISADDLLFLNKK